MRYALKLHGFVHEIFPFDPMLGPAFDVADVTDQPDVVAGWTANGDGSFTPPPAPPPPTVDELVAYAAARRYAIEVGGVATALGRVATDDRSKVMILGSRMAAQLDPAWSRVWLFAAGASATVRAAEITAMSDAVQAHVAGVFAAFETIKAAITAVPPTITTMAAIDAALDAPGA